MALTVNDEAMKALGSLLDVLQNPSKAQALIEETKKVTAEAEAAKKTLVDVEAKRNEVAGYARAVEAERQELNAAKQQHAARVAAFEALETSRSRQLDEVKTSLDLRERAIAAKEVELVDREKKVAAVEAVVAAAAKTKQTYEDKLASLRTLVTAP